MRMAEGLHLNLPPVVEKYFEISSHTSKQTPYYYQNNVVTLATDGPNIVFIGKPDIALSMTKLYVEHMHWSMPSSYQIDANVSISPKKEYFPNLLVTTLLVKISVF